MRRSLAHRFLAGLFGLWTITTVSGVSLPACPEHGGGWLGGVVGADMDHHDGMPASGPMTDAKPAGHQGHNGGAPDAGHGGGHHGHQCTCPGACCATGLVSAPAGRLVTIAVVPVAIAAAAPLVYRDVAPRAAPDVVIPPPLGPPAQSV